MEQIFKSIDLGGLVPFAKGGSGECYRLNEDTILKLYYEGFPVERVLREKDGARAALAAGIPTAISIYLVQAGKRHGIMYEFVQGRTFSEIIAQSPERAEELGGLLAGVAGTLHNAEVKANDLISASTTIRVDIPKMDFIPKKTIRHIIQFLDTLDMDRHYVHGDFHPSNVIMSKDGPVLIDMEGFSVGCPLFDLATLRFNLFESPEALKSGRNSFNGLTCEEALKFWKAFEREYFGGEIDRESAELLHKITLLKKLKFKARYGIYFPKDYAASIGDEVNKIFNIL